MKVAYLVNTYPMASQTFIRREIHALERQGVEVERFAVRVWSEELVDPGDIRERDQTMYLLSGNAAGLVGGFFKELLSNPLGLLRGLKATYRLWKRAGEGFIRHGAYLLEAISLRRQMKAKGVRHVHAHFGANSTTVAMLARAMGGGTYSFTAHGPDEFLDPIRTGYDMKIANAAFVAAISNFCRVQLVRIGGMEHWDKIEIVPCALDFREFEKSTEGFEGERPLVCIGRLCPQKAQTLFPDAVEPLANDLPNIKIVLIGDGDTRAEIEEKIEAKGLQENFELVGWRSNQEVRAILAGARAMLLPSFAEGLPVSIMEAFALGRPVISTYIAGIPELVDSTCGWLIPAGDVPALTAALHDCMAKSPEELRRMGDIGRARVQAQHDVEKSATTLREAFERHA